MKKLSIQALNSDRSVCMAAIWYSGPLSTAPTNEQSASGSLSSVYSPNLIVSQVHQKLPILVIFLLYIYYMYTIYIILFLDDFLCIVAKILMKCGTSKSITKIFFYSNRLLCFHFLNTVNVMLGLLSSRLRNEMNW